MGRRGRKRQLVVEDEYWPLVLAGVGTVEAAAMIDEIPGVVDALAARLQLPEIQRAAMRKALLTGLAPSSDRSAMRDVWFVGCGRCSSATERSTPTYWTA